MYRLINLEPEGFSPEAAAILSRFASIEARQLTREELVRGLPGREILITRLRHEIDEGILARSPDLRVISIATTGLDHVDLDAAAARGIAVLSLRGETGFLETVTATAELAWGLVLALARRLVPAVRDVHAGNWRRDLFRGTELSGKALGVVGVGRLGRIVARYGRAFGMVVLGHDPHVRVQSAEVDRWRSLDDVLRAADVVTLHVPLSAQTRGLIDGPRIALMKPTAILVNTSRGAVVDERAILDALEGGRLAGAGLDVLAAEEGLRSGDVAGLAGDPLVQYARRHENLVLTPHLGGATLESMAKAEIFMARKLARHLGVPFDLGGEKFTPRP